MAKIAKRYVDEKIKRLDELIANATSPEQAGAYSNYRDFWIGQLTARQNPDKKLEKIKEQEEADIEAERLRMITAESEEADRREALELKKRVIREEMDAEVLKTMSAKREAEERELKATELLARIKELEAQILANKEDVYDEESEPEDSTNN